MSGYRYTLPTAGYLLLHTTTRDGEEPRLAETFWTGGKPQTDETARAHLASVVAFLADAPRDVLHELVEVQRTPDGDREIARAEVRGTGLTIAARKERDAAHRAEHWVPVTLTGPLSTKGGRAFERGDLALADPADLADASVTVYSDRREGLVVVPRRLLRVTR